jgi:hypothetical protein
MQDSVASIIYHLGFGIEEVCLYYYILRKSENGRLEMSAAKIGKEIDLTQAIVTSRIKKLTTPNELLGGKSLITLKRERAAGPFTYYITDISEENAEFLEKG